MVVDCGDSVWMWMRDGGGWNRARTVWERCGVKVRSWMRMERAGESESNHSSGCVIVRVCVTVGGG